jgi:hypothetical protein
MKFQKINTVVHLSHRHGQISTATVSDQLRDPDLRNTIWLLICRLPESQNRNISRHRAASHLGKREEW